MRAMVPAMMCRARATAGIRIACARDSGRAGSDPNMSSTITGSSADTGAHGEPSATGST
jgi:hypothetical protein